MEPESPPEGVENSGGNTPADNGPGNGALPNNIQVVTSGNADVAGALETFGGTVLTVLGFLFVEIGLGIAGFVLCFLGIGCCIFVICHHIRDSNFKYSKLLLWSLMICNAALFTFLIWREFVKTHQQTPLVVETRTEGWQPPELPNDCTNIFVQFGARQFSVPIWMASSHPPTDWVTFTRNVAPPELTNGWPEKAKSESFGVLWKMNVNGHIYDTPVRPFVKNRRLFIYAQTPYGKGQRKIMMSDDWDSQIPHEWDRNFSSNAFEIVNEAKRPVLQVYYRRSNEMEVSGLFILDTNETLAAFASTSILFFPDAGGLWAANMEGLHPGTNEGTFSISPTDPYATTLSSQKCIFKYPSWKYPGVLNE